MIVQPLDGPKPYKTIITTIEDFVKSKMTSERTGHDWWHVDRVRKLALKIANEEKLEKRIDLFVVELAALLHDVDDWKLNRIGRNATSRPEQAENVMIMVGVERAKIDQITKIIHNMSFKGAGVEEKMPSIEGKIVQDADRLDAIGAIGIARTFAYGGYKRRLIYDPAIKPKFHRSFDEYKNNEGTTINHFYEKLLLLKDRINTRTGKRIADKRHKFLKIYIKRFLEEWNIEKE